MDLAVPHSTFSFVDIARFAWAALRRHFGFLLSALLIATIAGLAPGLVQIALGESRPVAAGIVAIGSLLIGAIAGLGLVTISLQVHDSDEPDMGAFVDCADMVIQGVVVNLLVVLSVLLRMLPFALAALVLAPFAWAFEGLRPLVALVGLVGAAFGARRVADLVFAPLLVADRRAGPRAAIRASAALTRPVRRQVLLLLAAILLVNCAGALTAGVGLLITVPLSLLALVRAYRCLAKSRHTVGCTTEHTEVTEGTTGEEGDAGSS